MATGDQNASPNSSSQQKKEANEGAHWPVERQLTSAEVAERDFGKPVLAPEVGSVPGDPDLDPNVMRGGPSFSAGPARTETTRADARAAGLITEAKPGDPRTSTNSGGPLADAARIDAVRAANLKKASGPNTVSNPALQDEDGKTKPEVVKGMKAARGERDAADKAETAAEKKAADNK